MDVYLTRQIVILRQKNLEFLDEQLRAAQGARFDVGEGTRTDVAQAEASKASAIATLDAAKSDEKNAEANLYPDRRDDARQAGGCRYGLEIIAEINGSGICNRNRQSSGNSRQPICRGRGRIQCEGQ